MFENIIKNHNLKEAYQQIEFKNSLKKHIKINIYAISYLLWDIQLMKVL